MFSNFKMTSKKGAKETSQKQKSINWGMIVITLILLSIIIGYLIYNFTFDRTSRWAVGDVAPKRSRELLRKVKEDFKAETTKEKVSQKPKLVEETSSMNKSAAEITITPTQNKNKDQTAKPPKTSDTMKLPEKIVVNFELNSNELSGQGYEDLDGIAQLVSESPNLEIIIEGYTDSLGTYSYNKELSEFRAEIIKKYFFGKGIDPSRITAVGLGSQNFIATNDTEEGRRLNRRVEIKVKTK
jgi:general secretion pathway protein A